jgi:hypothetical protein
MTTLTTTDEDLYSNEVLSGGRWYHVVAVRNGTTQAIYLNGELDNSRACSPDPIDFVGGYDDDKVSIGRVTSAGVGQYYVDGKIDDVRIYDSALSAQEIQELYGQAQNGLVARWRFDEGSGSVAYDSAGDNDGVVYGAQWTTGQIGGALDFDGANDYVQVQDDPSLDGMAELTVCAWFKPEQLGRFQRIVSKWENGPQRSYVLSLNDLNKLVLGADSRLNLIQCVGATTLDQDRWYHGAGVYDRNGCRVFIDGRLDATAYEPGRLAIYAGSLNLRIGAEQDGSYPFGGPIDDVRIYSRALSAEEIQELYGQAQGGLVAHWRLDEGSGSGAYDSAGDNDGVVSGAQWTTGQIEGALSFDGINDYVALPDNNPIWLPQNNFTLSAWVYFDRAPAASGGETFLGLNYAASGNPSNELGYVVSRLAGSGRVAFGMHTLTTTDENLYSNAMLSGGRWYHVVAIRNGTTQAIYLNGELDNSRACSPDPIDFVGGYDDDKVSIGRVTSAGVGQYYVDGRIDDVRIYNRALLAEEIRELYGAAPPAAVYHIDGVAGNDLNDGLNRQTAFKTIQKGIEASDDGDEVVVWPGLYQEAINFKGKAIAVKSAAEPAVIEAAGMDAVTFHAGEGAGSVLKNFIIRNSGMAISTNYGSSPTISSLTIVNNDFGIGAYEDSDPNISNCIIWDNKYGDLFGCEARYSWVQQELEPDLEDPNGGLVSHWAFDEGAGLIAYDSAGNNDGVVFGAKWASGQLGGALDFDGADDYLEVSDNASLSLTGTVTVGAWIWLDPGWLPPGHGGAGVIVCKHRDVTGKGYSLRVQASRNLRALLNGVAVVSQSQVPVGRWTYVALTFDSSAGSAVLYINGGEDSSASIAGTLTASGCGLRIGDQSCYAGGTGSEVFYGVIDDVRIYGRALSASEVLQLYEPVASIDPLFADAVGGDYHLLSERGRYWPAHDVWVLDRKTSPCIDGGDPAVDPSGEPMPNGGRINIGAYGGTVQASMSEWPIASDYNRDGRTNFEDLAIFCEEWLATFPWADGQPAPPEPEQDLAPPTPNPATWDVAPYSTSSTVSMAATAASDESGVEYYFANVTVGGRASGWQASNNWTDTGLSSSTQYCYRVKTRDKSPNMNESAWSSTLCATTSSGGR